MGPNALLDLMNQKKKNDEYFPLILPSIPKANNEGIEVLDLRWNRIRMKGAVAFCAGLKVGL